MINDIRNGIRQGSFAMTSAPRSPETLNVSVQGQVAIVAMNRPEAMNAISMQMRADLRETLETLRRDPDIGAVVLTGNGEKAFSAGMDLREFAQTNAGMPVAEMKRFRWAQAEGIAAFDKPIIAAVNGVAIGGGLELALLCDLVFAAENATFAFAEIKRGLMPGNGGTQRLSRRIGQARALEMILTGRSVSAEEALALGLVEYVVPKAELLGKAVALAAQMAAQAPVAVRSAKAAIVRGAELSLDDGIRLEQDLAAFLYTTEDAQEGPRAFLEKRAPVWRGC
ncbi:enoyl-CoA hydratase/isomerase family protein [Tardiphaga sp. vice278]|uniref:enoyl-CoA hydratase/isomerase family protein n=1 Tax=Tardiphaga sp. vice278 TaxID=2592815 RepID=UPI001FF03901|nr:enoyl-CoA hydratase/isomerase family protein [Tardiphaga sp. vice278]